MHKDRSQFEEYSYPRVCAGNMKHNLKGSYKTGGFVKLGACIDTLIASATGDIEYLRNKYITVFLGHTNYSYISKNNSQWLEVSEQERKELGKGLI
jgi:hypothetical protein